MSQRGCELGDQIVGRVSGVVPVALNDLPVDGSAFGVGVDRIAEVDLAGLVVLPAFCLLAQFIDDARSHDVSADRGVRGWGVLGFGLLDEAGDPE